MELNERDKAMILKNLRRINEYVTGFNSTFLTAVTNGEFSNFRVRFPITIENFIESLNVSAYIEFVVKKDLKSLSLIIYNRDGVKNVINLADTEETERILNETKCWGVGIMILLHWKDIHDKILSGIHREERIYNAIYDFKL